MMLNTVANIISVIVAASAPSNATQDFFSIHTRYNILSKPPAAFPYNHCRNIMASGKRGMDPVAMTIFDPQKEYWPSHGPNQLPVVLNSRMQSIDQEVGQKPVD